MYLNASNHFLCCKNICHLETKRILFIDPIVIQPCPNNVETWWMGLNFPRQSPNYSQRPDTPCHLALGWWFCRLFGLNSTNASGIQGCGVHLSFLCSFILPSPCTGSPCKTSKTNLEPNLPKESTSLFLHNALFPSVSPCLCTWFFYLILSWFSVHEFCHSVFCLTNSHSFLFQWPPSPIQKVKYKQNFQYPPPSKWITNTNRYQEGYNSRRKCDSSHCAILKERIAQHEERVEFGPKLMVGEGIETTTTNKNNNNKTRRS